MYAPESKIRIGAPGVSLRRRTIPMVLRLLMPVVPILVGVSLSDVARGEPPMVAGDDDVEEKVLREVSDEEAETALERFAVLVESGDEKAIAAGLVLLGDCPHRDVVKGIADSLDDRNPGLRVAACQALGKMNNDLVRKPLISALRARRNQDEPKVLAAVVTAIGDARVTGLNKRLLDLIPNDASQQDPEVVKAAIVALGIFKEKRVIDPLIKILEIDPNDQPTNPGPSDPPASYWKAIWKRWVVVEGSVRSVLTDLTGETFANGQEAREWYKKNRRRLRLP